MSASLLFPQYTTNALPLGPCTFSFPTAWRILFRCAPGSLSSGFSSDTTFLERPYLTILAKKAAWTSPFSVLLSYFIFLLSPYNHVFICLLFAIPHPHPPTIRRQSPRDLCWFWRGKGAEIEWCLEYAAAAAAKSLQLCPTLCDPIDGSPPGSPVPGILQARTLQWGAISFSNAWKWNVKVKLLSRVLLFATPWTAAYQAPPSIGFSRQEYWNGVPLLSLPGI